MRKGWEYKKLGEIAKCAIGLTYKPENVTEELSGTIVLRSSNIQNSILDFNDIVRVNVPVKEDKIVKDGDILMCSRNGSIRLVGKVALIKNLKERMSYGAFMTIIRSQYNPYLFEYFKTPAFRQYLIAGKTTTVNQITVKMLNNLTIPLPPKSTQLAIVSELDKINELIRLKKEQLKDFDNLAQSLFYEMFGDPVENEKGWEVKKLGELLKVIGGYAFKSDKYKDEGIPILRIGNINSGFFRDTNLVFAESDEKLERYKIFPGDIVISLTGTVGKSDYGNVCIMDDAYNFYYLNQRNAKLEIFGNLDKYYLSAILKNEVIKSRLTSISRGVRQANIANKDIENLQIPLPPLPLQRLFAQRIEQIEREKSEVQKSIQDLETLLASRMQYWFE